MGPAPDQSSDSISKLSHTGQKFVSHVGSARFPPILPPASSPHSQPYLSSLVFLGLALGWESPGAHRTRLISLTPASSAPPVLGYTARQLKAVSNGTGLNLPAFIDHFLELKHKVVIVLRLAEKYKITKQAAQAPSVSSLPVPSPLLLYFRPKERNLVWPSLPTFSNTGYLSSWKVFGFVSF